MTSTWDPNLYSCASTAKGFWLLIRRGPMARPCCRSCASSSWRRKSNPVPRESADRMDELRAFARLLCNVRFDHERLFE